MSSTGVGNGGDIVYRQTGNVITGGAESNAVFLQSIGGGGGSIDNKFAGSAGGHGSGGTINISHNGNIITQGESSHGIFAQSAATHGFGGTVTVNLDGNIAIQGIDADGILAQSLGERGGSNISVNILGDIVQGGSGNGAGVHIVDGRDNVMNNNSTITSINGLTGNAILGTGGNETINNKGTVIGLVDLGSGKNAFNNDDDGIFITGASVKLGEGNPLTNAGIVSPGGNTIFQTTELTGNFVQTRYRNSGYAG